MKISHYLYNTFVIKTTEHKIAIDPGAMLLYPWRFTTLIPESEWPDITHILVTHGDPDHYWHTDHVARASGATVICNSIMVRNIDGSDLLLGPRSRGLAFDTEIENVKTLNVDDEIEVDGVQVRGIKATHGPLVLKFGPFSKAIEPGPHERVGWGAIGFSITVEGKTLVNLGDTLLHLSAWESLRSPDILMIPIGGKSAHNTMDEENALKAVEMIRPKIVIPCHYNCPAFFRKNYNPADAEMFSRECRKLSSNCVILGNGNSVTI
ncbi:MAG: MBL fold metallo-hydrolase [Pseudomonadales bacterium]|nr:MBL fold metallo-hydrolase [Pseudomonadales bacterium]